MPHEPHAAMAGPGAGGDTQDWTWVLHEPCAQCGLDAASWTLPGIADGLRDAAAAWREVLARQDVARRPAPGVWSPLEYSAHVRDLLVVFRGRLARLRQEVDPVLDGWDQDEAAVAGRYGSLDPATVADELAVAATALADDVAGVRPPEAARPGRRGTTPFTVTTLLQYLWHDVAHHLHDVGTR